MDMTSRILTAAERLFDRHGFAATSMDRLTASAGMSGRTLYKHAGSKIALMAAVLSERERRFMLQLDVRSVDAVFEALEEWVRSHGARGCLFLRAHAETGGDAPEITDLVMAHKTAFRDRVADIVAADIGGVPDPVLVDQIVVLCEGATATAAYCGPVAISAARAAAGVLVERARP